MPTINALSNQVNTVAAFEADLSKLLEVMGKSRVTTLANGAAYVTYQVGGTVGNGTAAEGTEIPLSGLTIDSGTAHVLAWKKYRDTVGIESIQSKGYDVAVGGKLNKLLQAAIAGIRKDICAAIKTGSTTKLSDGSTALKGATFQAAAAKAGARLAEVAADEACTPVFFASPMTAADYLGSASITTQTAFGLQYVEGFMGMGTLVVLPGLADASVYATAQENIEIVTAEVQSLPDLEMTVDASGCIGVHVGGKASSLAEEIVIASGLTAFLNVADHCCIATVGA